MSPSDETRPSAWLNPHTGSIWPQRTGYCRVPLYTLDAVATMLEEQAHSVLEEFNVTPDAWDAARWLRSLTQEET